MVQAISTYNQEKMREDVSDVVFNISPTEVPFQSQCRVGSAHNRTCEWQTDDLSPAGPNSLVEGAETATATDTPAVTVQQNWQQIFNKVAIVSNTANAVDFYGRSKELAYNLSKKAQEMKRDLEYALLNNQVGEAGSGVVAREMKSVQALAGTVLDNGGTERALGETDFLVLLQSMYEKGADPTSVFVTPAHAQQVAAWSSTGASGANTIQHGRRKDSGMSKTIVQCVDYYISPYGEARIYIDRFQAPTDLIVADMEYAELAYLRKPQIEKLAKIGDSERRLLVSECTFKANSLDAFGVLADLTVDGGAPPAP